MIMRRQDGFTLLETLISLTLFGILVAAFALLLGSTVLHSSEIREHDLLQTEARGAINLLVQDLRQAYGDDQTVAIEAAANNRIRFLSPDRSQPFRLRRIEYQVSGNKLQRAYSVSTNSNGPPWTFPGSLGAWSTQVDSLVNTTPFSYLDENGAATTIAADVRTALVTLTLGTKTSEHRRQFTFNARVGLRTMQ